MDALEIALVPCPTCGQCVLVRTWAMQQNTWTRLVDPVSPVFGVPHTCSQTPGDGGARETRGVQNAWRSQAQKEREYA